MTPSILPPLPGSWSELTWQQMIDCWNAKLRYGGNGDVAQAAALLALCRLTVTGKQDYDPVTGEDIYRLCGDDGRQWTVTARELAAYARQAIPWFAFPYGDPGEPAVRDDKGKVTKEARDPVRGYVDPMNDALSLQEQEVMVGGSHFALPQLACNNLTWQQYRSLQAIAPQLFAEGITDEQALDLQAQFMAHCLVPAAVAPKQPSGDPFSPAHTFRYDVDRAEQTVPFWRQQLVIAPALFHICFQCYQTALGYYSRAYPLLFSGDGKQDPYTDALKGEVGTVNAVMHHAHYSSQQEVYDSNLPFILDILNTMTKEAKDIEQMNARIKSKR